ncbi:MAG: multifunctional CCA addition/repair protein [Betaproteobacteria bacterium]|nr:multifunctional CCA addition/repair protein [Betaproteobacteria bacterium]
MRIYVVGGAVRDELLGRAVADRDYLVVGATPEDMARRGFRPVGKDFPVFLHPETHEEYALARTERKSGRGYKGFQVYAAPEVTLEQDLGRRDLTINAMAKDESGTLIDPFGGARDLEDKCLRHVSGAFVEDPVRILRVARFAARFPDFRIAPETLNLMREMVASGEVDALVPERVWQEFSRGLMESRPSRMIEALRACGALARLAPEIDRLFGVPQPEKYHPEIDTGAHVLLVIDFAAARAFALPVRYAALTHDLGKGTTPRSEWPHHVGHEDRGIGLVDALSQRLRAPGDCRDLAHLTVAFHGQVHQAPQMRPAALLTLLHATDALRQRARFGHFLEACRADYGGRPGFENRRYEAADWLEDALEAALAVDAGAVAKCCADPGRIREAVWDARLAAIASWIRAQGGADGDHG